jgi:hypothetical protein
MEADMSMPTELGNNSLKWANACLTDFSGYEILERNEEFRHYFSDALIYTKKLYNLS